MNRLGDQARLAHGTIVYNGEDGKGQEQFSISGNDLLPIRRHHNVRYIDITKISAL
jgi:hypothetical protein